MTLTWRIHDESASGIRDAIRSMADVGIGGVELCLRDSMCADWNEEACRLLMGDARRMGVAIASIQYQGSVNTDAILHLLSRAQWLGAGTLKLNNPEFTAGNSNPGDAEHAALAVLLEWRFHAQRHGVILAWPTPINRMLRSPVEAREFFDRANSPFVGAAITAQEETDACTWVQVLTHRIAHVEVAAGFPDDAAASLRSSLERIPFAGPVVIDADSPTAAATIIAAWIDAKTYNQAARQS